MSPTTTKKTATSALDFEKSFSQLEGWLESLENSDLALEDALKKFEQGIKLTTSCQKALNKAEQKVQVLMKKNNSLTLENL
ncbi:MAG: exodeoxyribonuclease VII small subunit [Thiotrichaceae bacterium]|nr:exodeoxyribonuclease VII small subunit [Thiotrichaceae bacterium]